MKKKKKLSKKRRTKSEKSKKKKKKKKSSDDEEGEYGVGSVEEDEVKEDSDYGTGKRSSKRNRTPKSAPETPPQAGR